MKNNILFIKKKHLWASILIFSIGCAAGQVKPEHSRWPVPGVITFIETSGAFVTLDLKPDGSVVCIQPDSDCRFVDHYGGAVKRWAINSDDVLLINQLYVNSALYIPPDEETTAVTLGRDSCDLSPKIAVRVIAQTKGAGGGRAHFTMTTDLTKLTKECRGIAAKAKADRLKELSAKYGKKYAALIAENRFSIGMTKAMVIEAIGQPDDINRTVTTGGVSEQWIYGRTYVYFSGDRVTSFQD